MDHRMISRHHYPFFLTFMIFMLFAPFMQAQIPYKNSQLPIEERVNDLISRMTIEEKFWQLFMIPGDLDGGKEKYINGIFGLQVSAKASNDAAAQLLNYNSSNTALETARKINSIQKYFVEETRLGIPIIAFEEALHGLVGGGATTSSFLSLCKDKTIGHGPNVGMRPSLACHVHVPRMEGPGRSGLNRAYRASRQITLEEGTKHDPSIAVPRSGQ